MHRSLSVLAAPVVLIALLGAGPAEPSQTPPQAASFDYEQILQRGRTIGRRLLARYEAADPVDRAAWGALALASLFGVGVVFERAVRLRRRRIIPAEFPTRFLNRLEDGKLDRGKALDYCELNPSPAARVALAAVRRWGRPLADIERAAAVAQRVEAATLRRNVAALRRIAGLTPLIGLLGTLVMLGRVFTALGSPDAAPWGPAVAAALAPLTGGVAIAVVALVLHDLISGRVESLVSALDRIAAGTLDAIAMAAPPEPRSTIIHAPAKAVPPPNTPQRERSAHQIRLEVPKPDPRAPIDLEDDYE